MNVDVTLLFDNQTDLDANRTALYFLSKAETRHHSIHPGTSVRTTCSQTHFSKLSMIRDSCTLDREIGTFNPTASMPRRAIHHSSERLINNGDNALGVFNQAYLDREITVALNESGCAVEWIDHPHTPLAKTTLGVD